MLRFNEAQGAFVLTSDDVEAAEAAGFTLSTSMRGPGGEKVWYTASTDYQRYPVYNPYAALAFYREADDQARARLADLYAEYLSSWADSTSYEPAAPPGMEYHPFQKAGIEYVVRKGNALIGDQPGLGKTIQAIGVANEVDARRVLVVCPASVRLHWQDMVRRWSTIPNVSTYPVLKSVDGVNPFCNFVIISYNLATNPILQQLLCQVPWDLVVADEAHFLKNIDALRTRALFGGGERFGERYIARHAKRVLGLTGTPLPNRPRECYNLARALDWECIDWMSEDRFRYRFNPSVRMDTGHVEETRGRLPELQARLRCNIMVRRLKKDVLKDLPPLQMEMVHVEPNGAIKRVLAKEALIDFDPDEDLFSPDFDIEGEISTIRREMGEAMVPRIAEHVRYLLDIVEVPKLLLFNHHRSVISMLAEALHRYGMVTYWGGMTPLQKEIAKREFIENPDIRIFSGQNDAAGTGTDGLQAVASYVVIGEPSWRSGDNEQIMDRAHRMGQLLGVIAQFLVAEGSFNERVLYAVLDKAKSTHATLDKRTA